MNARMPRTALVNRSLVTFGLVTLGLTASASAQFSATYIAKTKMVATAYYSVTGAKSAEIPINTDLSKGKSISIVNVSRASVGVSFSNTSTGLRATISESGNAYYSSLSSRGSSLTGAHQTLLTVKSATPTNVILRVSYSVRNSARYASTVGRVDIGNNGTFEFAGSSTTLSKDFPVTIDSSGLQIATTTSGRASPNSTQRSASFFCALQLQILPGNDCLMFKHGTACGVALNGRNGFGGKVTLDVSGGSANASGLLIIGAQRIDAAIPGTACRLLVQPVISVPIQLDASGAVSITGSVPPVRPFAIPIQVGVPGATLATSNSLTIICP